MSSTMTSSSRRRGQDHFEPDNLDPHEQRRLRGQLEQIDYTAFAANKALIGQILGSTDAARFQRLAVAAAQARAQWVAQALALSEIPHALTAEQTAGLTQKRTAYEELTEAYEAMRRMVERGYLDVRSGPATE